MTGGIDLKAEDRLRHLYEAYAHRVLAYAARRTDHHEARDVVSQTFLVTWRRIDEVPDDAIGWLLAVARKILANERRASSRRASLSERASIALENEGDFAGAVTERIGALEALDRMSAWDREALMLMAWERLDYKTAAQVMACSVSIFKVRLHRARSKLSRFLASPETNDGRVLAPRSTTQEVK
jgi:RNA polymerase sigma-70 factor (ECF subfamily)